MRILPFLLACSSGLSLAAADGVLASDGYPEVVRVGMGSYASRPPRDQNKRPWLADRFGWGDDSQLYSRMPLYVSPENLTGAGKRPIPSTDWWTSLVTTRWSGQLWMFPSVVKATPGGVEFYTPNTWFLESGGRAGHMTASVKLLFGAENFAPTHAEAVDWSDWMVRGRLKDAGEGAIDFSAVHGGIFTVFEYSANLRPVISLQGDAAKAFGMPAGGAMLGIECKDALFGIYAPSGSKLSFHAGSVRVEFPAKAKHRFLSIAPLNSREDLLRYAPYAAMAVRSTDVSWKYSPEKGAVETTWTIRAEDLEERGRTDVLQGWLPHHYQLPTIMDFTPDFAAYPCPRGELRVAVGTRFVVTFPFKGLLPAYPRPDEKAAGAPFDPVLMKQLIESHLGSTGYGSETYWGGKRVLHFGRYMDMARQSDMPEAAAIYRDRAAEAVRDWLTFTPGEGEHFFAWYPRWGSFVGCRSRDNANPGVDILQDHHMCYGYHLYTAALLFFQDKKLAADYGPMARLVAKDYAEWDAKSAMFCRFRNLDPWSGHSWSGGLGSEQGNGQESSSEAMQGYGAMFLLGESLGDVEMRDAAAFCWAMEARGIAEYYFDRGKRNLPKGWPHTMNTNVHTDGIGFWTWFSTNPFWMHAIQWLPMSPLLSYLFEDPAYAESDFNEMWRTHEGGQGWDGYFGTDSPVANLVLNYLAGFDAERAAETFKMLADRKLPAVSGVEAAHTYWRMHALKSLGPHCFDAWTDVPTSQVFGKSSAPGALSWVVFNAGDSPREVRCFVKGELAATFSAPPNCLSVMKNNVVTSDLFKLRPAAPPAKQAAPISLNASVSASSELGGNKAAHVTDGNPGSRWESRHADNEWLAIDLRRKCRVERIELVWEGAYATDYDLQFSADGKNWSTLKSVRSGKGKSETHTLSGSGRYLRILCLRRGTPWGNSLFSVAVYGQDASENTLRIVPALAQVNELDKVKFSAFVVSRDGKETPAKDVQWEVVPNRYAGGVVSPDGIFTPKGASNYEEPRIRIRASQGDMSTEAAVVVEEALRVGNIALSPFPAKGPLKAGRGTEFPVSAEAFDQFGVLLDDKVAVGVRGDAVKLKDGRLRAHAPGRAVVFAELSGVRVEREVEVVPEDQADIAAGCPATSSSSLNGNDAFKAFDRDASSRWESAFQDPQWIQVDFGKRETLSRAVLIWEGAHARKYTLNVSEDALNWKRVHREENCRGGREEIHFPAGTQGRYLRLIGTERASAYGYSLWSFEVFRAR